MSGISGSALAELGGLAELEIKAMEDEGYERSFAAAFAASAAINGPIFPPSIPLVIYAMLAEVSSVKELIAGTLPGIVLTIFLAVYVVWVTPSKLRVKSSFGEVKPSEADHRKYR
jgi:TRAP-type C4-dicarboxylate transport system permease large subunit